MALNRLPEDSICEIRFTDILGPAEGFGCLIKLPNPSGIVVVVTHLTFSAKKRRAAQHKKKYFCYVQFSRKSTSKDLKTVKIPMKENFPDSTSIFQSLTEYFTSTGLKDEGMSQLEGEKLIVLRSQDFYKSEFLRSRPLSMLGTEDVVDLSTVNIPVWDPTSKKIEFHTLKPAVVGPDWICPTDEDEQSFFGPVLDECCTTLLGSYTLIGKMYNITWTQGRVESDVNVGVPYIISLSAQMSGLNIDGPQPVHAAVADIPSEIRDSIVAGQTNNDTTDSQHSSEEPSATTEPTENSNTPDSTSTMDQDPPASTSVPTSGQSNPTTVPDPPSDTPFFPLQNTDIPAGGHAQSSDHTAPRIERVSDLTMIILHELAIYLDADKRTINNWRHLASHLHYDSNIDTLELEYKKDSGSPTMQLLKLEASDNNCTIKHLKDILALMKRRDVLKIFDKHNL